MSNEHEACEWCEPTPCLAHRPQPAPVIVLDGLTPDEVRVITGLVRAMRESERRGYSEGHEHGIREGERRMLWAIAVGAEWDRVRCEDEAAEEWSSAHSEAMQVDAAASSGAAWGFAATCKSALRALALRGDEDASRVWLQRRLARSRSGGSRRLRTRPTSWDGDSAGARAHTARPRDRLGRARLDRRCGADGTRDRGGEAMTHKYKAGDRVEVLRGNRWLPGTVSGKMFNGGSGGYWSVDLDNGDGVVMDAARVRRLA